MTDARARRSAQTEAERRLWSVLRGRQLDGAKFRRQHPLGPTVLDFACVEHRLVIEADGGQHADSEHDGRRTAWLDARGWRVIRFWNNEILENIEGIRIAIQQALKENPRPRAGRPGMAAFDPSPPFAVEPSSRPATSVDPI